MALLSHSYIQCELLQFDQETQAVRPKSVSLQKKGQPLKTFFQEKLKSEEQLAWRAVSIKLHVNVMLRKYSLHPNKRRQITDYLNDKITQLDASDIIPHTEKRKSDEELATC